MQRAWNSAYEPKPGKGVDETGTRKMSMILRQIAVT
jgi:hypothetical protein